MSFLDCISLHSSFILAFLLIFSTLIIYLVSTSIRPYHPFFLYLFYLLNFQVHHWARLILVFLMIFRLLDFRPLIILLYTHLYIYVCILYMLELLLSCLLFCHLNNMIYIYNYEY